MRLQEAPDTHLDSGPVGLSAGSWSQLRGSAPHPLSLQLRCLQRAPLGSSSFSIWLDGAVLSFRGAPAPRGWSLSCQPLPMDMPHPGSFALSPNLLGSPCRRRAPSQPTPTEAPTPSRLQVPFSSPGKDPGIPVLEACRPPSRGPSIGPTCMQSQPPGTQDVGIRGTQRNCWEWPAPRTGGSGHSVA